MGDDRDPRFLGGEKAVLTDTRDMALVVAIAHDGTADITANISKAQAAAWLRHIADQWDPPAADTTTQDTP